jgi:hypothetical protein
MHPTATQATKLRSTDLKTTSTGQTAIVLYVTVQIIGPETIDQANATETQMKNKVAHRTRET